MAADIRFPNLGIELGEVGTGINLFGFDIAFYGMIIALGMVAGVMMAEWQAKRTGQNGEVYLDFALYAIASSILGARAYYVAFEWDYYRENPAQILNLRGGGLAILGGVIAAIVTGIVYCRFKKLSFWLLADTGTVGLVTGQIIGRWGNFFNREVFGGYTNGLFAMQLKRSQVDADNITEELYQRMVTIGGVEYIQVHPTFLYESLWNVMVLLAMIWFTKRKKVDGEIFCLYLFGYGLGRLWIEGIRTDQLLLWGTGLPVSQLLSGVMIVIAIVLFVLRRKRFVSFR